MLFRCGIASASNLSAGDWDAQSFVADGTATVGGLCDFGLWLLTVSKSESRRFCLEMPGRRRFIPQS